MEQVATMAVQKREPAAKKSDHRSRSASVELWLLWVFSVNAQILTITKHSGGRAATDWPGKTGRQQLGIRTHIGDRPSRSGADGL